MTRDGGGTTFEAVIGTNEGQVAVAPGVLQGTWSEGGRSYFQYVTDTPGNEWAFFSAKYKVHEAKWKNPDGSGKVVAIQIFHHPSHTAHLERMVRSIRASLDYYTAQFGPIWYSQIKIVEGPGNGTGIHAEPGMLTHSEGFTSWNPKNDDGSLDVPSAVVAHEMAHQ
jgi:hypothetical protein